MSSWTARYMPENTEEMGPKKTNELGVNPPGRTDKIATRSTRFSPRYGQDFRFPEEYFGADDASRRHH
jgi:hypothetical protein